MSNIIIHDFLPIIEFLRTQLQQEINNNPNESTTKYIDAVFSRHIDKIMSKIYVSYFYYYKPIISFIELIKLIFTINVYWLINNYKLNFVAKSNHKILFFILL